MDVQSAPVVQKPTGTAAEKSSAKLAETYDQFLSLLTTQLRHQNPLDPMDSTQFVQQLVQFSGVEQAISTNKRLEELLALQSTNQTLGALGLIGKTVDMEGDDLVLADGKAELSYRVDKQVIDPHIIIRDASGNVLTSFAAESAAGSHSFVWNGQGANGSVFPDGAYKVSVAGTDQDGNVVELSVQTRARVTGVETGADGVLANLGPISVPMASIVAINETEATETTETAQPASQTASDEGEPASQPTTSIE